MSLRACVPACLRHKHSYVTYDNLTSFSVKHMRANFHWIYIELKELINRPVADYYTYSVTYILWHLVILPVWWWHDACLMTERCCAQSKKTLAGEEGIKPPPLHRMRGPIVFGQNQRIASFSGRLYKYTLRIWTGFIYRLKAFPPPPENIERGVFGHTPLPPDHLANSMISRISEPRKRWQN